MPAAPDVTIWADPGKMTGWASYDTHTGVFLSGQELFLPFGRMLTDTVAFLGHRVTIGWEMYTVPPGAVQKSSPAFALEVIGMIKWIGRDCTLAKPTMPGDRAVAHHTVLRNIGWWAPGKEHANVAAQHLLTHLADTHRLTDAMTAAFRTRLTQE